MEDQADSDPLSYILHFVYLSGDVIIANIAYGLVIIMLLILSASISSIDFAFLSLNNESADAIKKSNLLYFKRITFLLHNKKKISITFRIIRTIVLCATGVVITNFILSTSAAAGLSSAGIILLITILSIALISISEIFPRLIVKSPLEFLAKSFFISFTLLKIFSPISKFLVQLNNKKKVLKKTSGEHLNEMSAEPDKKEEEEEFDDENHQMHSTSRSLEALSLRKIMVNRLDIRAFDWEMTFDEILKEINRLGFSRIPIYKETIDNVEGILYVKDLLFHIEEKGVFDWHSIIRPGFFIPESKKIDDLLKEFQEKKVHMAIIVDEYGGTSGLVTMEDILEEIVGDINDEFDQNQNNYYSTLDENTFIFEGETPLEDFLNIYSLNGDLLAGETHKTLSEFLIEQLGSLPEIGEQIKFNKFEFTIIGVDDKKINRVKVYIQDQSNKEEHFV